MAEYELYIHGGLIIGTVIGIAAPGNFLRLSQSHDAIPMQSTIFARISLSIQKQMEILDGYKEGYILGIIFLIFILFVFYEIIRKRIKFADIFNENIEYFFMIAILPIIWGFFPYTPRYGAIVLVFFVIVLIIRSMLGTFNTNQKTLLGKIEDTLAVQWLSTLCIVVLIVINFSWMSSMIQTTKIRRIMVKNAIHKKVSQVVVPRYSDIYSNRFNMFNYNNKTTNYKKIFYGEYYNVLIIPQKIIKKK